MLPRESVSRIRGLWTSTWGDTIIRPDIVFAGGEARVRLHASLVRFSGKATRAMVGYRREKRQWQRTKS